MSLEGSSLGPPALPPPVVFLDNLSADTIHGESPLTNSKSLPPAATQVKYAEQIDIVEAGLEPLEEDLGVEDGEDGEGGEDELNYEEDEEWEDMMAASNLGKQGGGAGDLRERTDIRNFNYDVIVDFVNQGRFILQGISNCYIGTVEMGNIEHRTEGNIEQKGLNVLTECSSSLGKDTALFKKAVWYYKS